MINQGYKIEKQEILVFKLINHIPDLSSWLNQYIMSTWMKFKSIFENSNYLISQMKEVIIYKGRLKLSSMLNMKTFRFSNNK